MGQACPAPVANLQVLADRDGLARCLALTESVCEQLSLNDEDTQAVRLAVEEACSNVVDHGYAGLAPGPLTLTFRVPMAGWLQAEVADRAKPFHPEEAPAPDLLSDSDDRPIGGLGWFFIHQVMTEVTYQSNAEGNCLVLRRQLSTVLSTEPKPC